MDVRKLRGPFLQIHYSFLRLIAAIKDVLEADQAMGLIKELTAAQFGSTYAVGLAKISAARALFAGAPTSLLAHSCGVLVAKATARDWAQGPSPRAEVRAETTPQTGANTRCRVLRNLPRSRQCNCATRWRVHPPQGVYGNPRT